VTVPAGLPHAYPFRFVETVLEPRDADFSRGTVGVAVSANGRAAAGEAWQSPLLLAEAIAQSALLLEGGDPEVGRSGFLAGLDGFRVARPPRAGEMLEVRVRLSARFGAIVKFEGEVLCGSETLARGSVLVRKGGTASAP
jgi:3-hydroxyacyl-[acyl-carrier-protein] dehydratase